MYKDKEELKIIEHYENTLTNYHLDRSQILEIRQAIIRIADQIMDHYFDSLGDL